MERASHRDRSWGVLTETPRGRGFSPTWFNTCLRAIQMAWVVRDREWPCEPSQDFGTVCCIFRDCFRIVRGLIFGLSNCPCFPFLCVRVKMNNGVGCLALRGMLVVL